jgi:DNA repair protein RecO (recombination protein O)
MNQIVTTGIVLTRTDFQEADRILTLLSPDRGKVRVVAKGVRRAKSKLAGGIELFSVSDITYIPGRGELGTLVSTRLKTHFGNIVSDINRTMFGYELIKRLHKATEDAADTEYFELLLHSFEGLDNGLSLELLEVWFSAQLLRLAGRSPNLRTDTESQPLQAAQTYTFDLDTMAFAPQPDGRYGAEHIKLLRLAFGIEDPAVLAQVQGLGPLLAPVQQLLNLIIQTN